MTTPLTPETLRTADQRHSPEGWIADLHGAGWIEVRLTVWKSPDGALWRGPYGAWVEMLRDRVRQ